MQSLNKNFRSYKLHKLGTPSVAGGQTDGQSEPTTRPAFSKATQAKRHKNCCLLQPLSIFPTPGLFASEEFCHLLITFANSLDTDQDGHFVSPDLDPNHLTF